MKSPLVFLAIASSLAQSPPTAASNQTKDREFSVEISSLTSCGIPLPVYNKSQVNELGVIVFLNTSAAALKGFDDAKSSNILISGGSPSMKISLQDIVINLKIKAASSNSSQSLQVVQQDIAFRKFDSTSLFTIFTAKTHGIRLDISTNFNLATFSKNPSTTYLYFILDIKLVAPQSPESRFLQGYPINIHNFQVVRSSALTFDFSVPEVKVAPAKPPSP